MIKTENEGGAGTADPRQGSDGTSTQRRQRKEVGREFEGKHWGGSRGCHGFRATFRGRGRKEGRGEKEGVEGFLEEREGDAHVEAR